MSATLKYAFHITHINNISHVLQCGLVRADSPLRADDFISIGDPQIIQVRGEREVKGFLATFFCLFVHQSNPCFGGGFPFSYEAGVNSPKAVIEWVKGNGVDGSIIVSWYGRMMAKDDCFVLIRGIR